MKTQRIESPFEQWPGWIELPEFVDAQQFYDWYTRSEELESNEEDLRPGILRIWDGRFGFILKHDMQLGNNQNGEPYQIEKSGLKLPSLKIAMWFKVLTDPLIKDAQDIKNLPGRSDDTSSTTD